MTRARWILIVVLVLVFGLAAVMLSRTKLAFTGQGLKDGRLEVETSLPLLTCRKTFLRAFPFVDITCEDAEPGQSAEPADAAP